jgi:2-polyprenyl-6-methoxyphenol hydroxylase-like FAD-dependent oxidoreductase
VIGRYARAKRIFQEPLVAVWSVGRKVEPGAAVTDRTLIQSVKDGWWYGAVLPDRSPIAAFHCSPETAKRFRRAPRDWLIALESAEVLSGWLATGAFLGAKLHFSDASGSVGEPVAGDGWIACGDAAVSFDPISSQGLLNAIRTGAAVASAIVAGDTTRAFRDYRAEIRTVWKIYCETRARFYHGLELLA